MRFCLIWNARAGEHPAAAACREWVRTQPGWTLREADDADALARAVRTAAADGFDRVVIVGGDGTVHAALNALEKPGPTVFALVPLGTGNDLARTLALPFEPLEALKLAARGRVHVLDSVAVSGDVNVRMINAANGGFAGMVTASLTKDRKDSWGPLAYLRQAADSIVDPPTWDITASFNGGPLEHITVLNVVVANGRTAAGGVVVAPAADPESGRLDVLLVTESDPLNRAVVTVRLLAGDYDRDEAVQRRRVRSFELTSTTPMPFSIDGEQCEGRHWKFEAVPQSVPFVVGPGYRRKLRSRWSLTGMGSWLLAVLGAVFRVLRAVPRALWPGLGLLALLTLLAAQRSHWRALDESLLRGLETTHTPLRTNLAIGFAELGDTPGMTILSVLGVAYFLIRKQRRNALMLAVVMILGSTLNTFLKQYFTDVRPGVFLSPYPARGYSFPSGHAQAATAYFGTLILLIPRWFIVVPGLLLAVGIYWCRLYLGVHWPTDVLAGILVGLLAIMVGRVICARRASSDSPGSTSSSPPVR